MALRMIEMMVPEASASELAALSDELDLLGVWREPLEGGLYLLRVLVPSEQSEALIRELETRFQSDPKFRLVIFEVAATLPRPELPEDAKENERRDKGGKSGDEATDPDATDPNRVAVDELAQKLTDAASVNRVYLVTVVLSTVVAAIGLIRDDVAVIIGAMVIAPLLTPNMTLSVATTLGDVKLARAALRVNAAGLILAAAVSVLIGLVVPFDPQLDQIANRTRVSVSDVGLALAAGSAGALAFTTGLSAALVGVMVAVALLPPLVATGLLLGDGQWAMAWSALLLTATNVICVNLAGVGTFLFQGVQPRHRWEAERAKRMVKLAAAVWLGLLALLVAIILIANHAMR